MNIGGALARFIISALVLMGIGHWIPGFSVKNFGYDVAAAFVIGLLGWVVDALFGRNISHYRRGISAFVSGTIVLYVAKWFVPGIRVSLVGALLASLVIGIVDSFVPTGMLRSFSSRRPDE